MKILLSVLIFVLISCGKTTETTTIVTDVKQVQAEATERYFSTTEKIVTNVYYEPNAEPFTGTTPRGNEYWQILEDNLEALFQYRTTPPLLQVPKQIDKMIQIETQNKATWSAQEVFELHESTTTPQVQSGEDHFHIYFLKGNAESSNSVIGFSINGTTVVAIFKDVVTASGSSTVQRYTEQSTLVHEMGHALGLVNNGVPLTSNHEDFENQRHTSNSDCIMYWKNEGASDLRQFVVNIITTGNTVMWGEEVLKDVESISK